MAPTFLTPRQTVVTTAPKEPLPPRLRPLIDVLFVVLVILVICGVAYRNRRRYETIPQLRSPISELGIPEMRMTDSSTLSVSDPPTSRSNGPPRARRPRAWTTLRRMSSKELHRFRSQLGVDADVSVNRTSDEVVIPNAFRQRHGATPTSATFLLATQVLAERSSTASSSNTLVEGHSEDREVVADRSSISGEQPESRFSTTSQSLGHLSTSSTRGFRTSSSADDASALEGFLSYYQRQGSMAAIEELPETRSIVLPQITVTANDTFRNLIAALDGPEPPTDEEKREEAEDSSASRHQSRVDFVAFSEALNKRLSKSSWKPAKVPERDNVGEDEDVLEAPTMNAKRSARALVEGIEQLQKQLQKEEEESLGAQGGA